MRPRFVLPLLLFLQTPLTIEAQEPIDLFSDEPALGNDFIRIGVWNLRHINVEGAADDFLRGSTETEDFAILTATFGKAIKDLGLDLVAIVEHQPRAGEPNRLEQIQSWLQTNTSETWGRDETNIPYDDPTNPFGNLQFGVLWRTAKITIDTNADQLLEDLRQPRGASGDLIEQRLRAPWLVPVQAGSLSFDLMVLHLKSGAEPPQQEEVNAIVQFIEDRQTTSPGHLIVVGDWNIRPDRGFQRNRLHQLSVPTASGPLMRVLTVEEVAPTLQGWPEFGNNINPNSALATLIPFSHFNATALDSFLDHVAISVTFEEVFDHPIEVELASGETDLRPGVWIARPQIPEPDYNLLTDHLPIVLVLRTTDPATPTPPPAPGLRIVGALPNPAGDDRPAEEVHIQNTSGTQISLDGWEIRDSRGQSWELSAADGVVDPGGTVVVLRRSRPMALNNDGDTIVLLDPSDNPVDTRSYDDAASGQFISFAGA